MRKEKICKKKELDYELFALSTLLNSIVTSFIIKDDHIARTLYDLLSYIDDKVYGSNPENCDILDEKISIITIYEKVCD